MGISNDLPYQIEFNNPNYERSLRPLNNSEIEDLLQKIEILKIDPHSIGNVNGSYEGIGFKKFPK